LPFLRVVVSAMALFAISAKKSYTSREVKGNGVITV